MQQSKTFQRRMGSLSLVVITMLADLFAAWTSYAIGQYILPAYGIAIGAVGGFLGGMLGFAGACSTSILGSLQWGTTFYLFAAGGVILGMLFGLIVATRQSYGEVEFGQGLLAFLLTFITALALWFFYGIATHWTPVHASFHYPHASFLPNVISGWLCLALYLLTHLISFLIQNAPDEHLSRADPRGPIYAQVDRCYHLYTLALMRFDPPPLRHFKTPVDICFHEGEHKVITWDGRVLVVPRLLLHAENEPVLRTELGRQLMYFNGPDLSVLRFLNSYPHSLVLNFALILLGNFIVVPALVQLVASERWRGERVLDADRYAFLLGVGILLRQLLKLEQEQLSAQGQKDTNFPTLSERIDQLDALIEDEQRQMQQLGIPLPQRA